ISLQHNIGRRKDLEDSPNHESQDLFRKWIPIRRAQNHMDKLTLTLQFGIQFGIFLGSISKELECNNIDSYRRKRFCIDSNVIPKEYG
ncbi:hypothetical protein Goari_000698, partial [Gossypium aridum]|nr:hypothetical protein [Gossypium aridum]